jgi:hypothetical protein
MSLRYLVKRGGRPVTLTQHAELDTVMREVFIHGQRDVVLQLHKKPPQRIQVFDRDPGWPHPIFDSKKLRGGR